MEKTIENFMTSSNGAMGAAVINPEGDVLKKNGVFEQDNNNILENLYFMHYDLPHVYDSTQEDFQKMQVRSESFNHSYFTTIVKKHIFVVCKANNDM
mmetsp:Transcript_4119/g.6094  ORF Transcript_4119/g.6094 Transcript_4119/m.6094 type:complete len:97 (+) Transcript_4119:60-350(+)